MNGDRNLALEFVRVTEAAAIAAAAWIGKGDKKAADKAAVDAMRSRLKNIDFSGTVVIGEGQKDEAPELYVGEHLGTSKTPELDIAVDPLECTDSVAWGRYNALAVIATAPRGTLLNAPDTYMEKIGVGPAAAKGIDLDAPVAENLKNIAKALSKPIGEVTVVVLDRPRHEKLIAEIRGAGARVRLITDGDVAGGIAPCLEESPIDVLMGIGASAEAVLAAAAIRVFGGQLLCRFQPRNDKDLEEFKKCGITDLKKIYAVDDLVKSDQVTFTATGVIDGPLLPGVVFGSHHITTQSVVMRGATKTIRYIKALHHVQ